MLQNKVFRHMFGSASGDDNRVKVQGKNFFSDNLINRKMLPPLSKVDDKLYKGQHLTSPTMSMTTNKHEKDGVTSHRTTPIKTNHSPLGQHESMQ